MDYSIKICGEAGQGIQTVGETLSKVFSRSGYHVFTHQDYESRVRGGHNFYQVRLADKQISAPLDKINILIAFDRESIPANEKRLAEYGRIIFDSSSTGKVENPALPDSSYMDIPFTALAVEHGGNRIMANTVAIGAILGMLGMELEILFKIIQDAFEKKGEAVIKANTEAATAGYAFTIKQCLKCPFSTPPLSSPKMLIAGNDAIGLGAVASGCKFYSAYPMTPSTGIMLYVAGKAKEYGIIVEQAEDEISAINMALGASFAGVRAMTSSSGGGFALMVEGLSLAAMTETPIVIGLAQRPGPATGLPTKTEQADLLFALFTAHGEFPRVIFAPGTPEQAFYLTNKAFDMAEKYQIPVFVLTDQYLADTQWTFDGFDLTRLKYTDYRLRGDALRKLSGYNRHALADSGISPLAVPGESRHLVVTDSDEHNEEGHLIEDEETRINMVNKRLFIKLPAIRNEMEAPVLYGNSNPTVVLVGWGSTYGVIKEAVDELSKSKEIAMLHFSEVYPLPLPEKLDYIKLLNNAKTTICIENNATGQFAYLLKAETGFTFHKRINKYDGQPFTLEYLLGELDAIPG